MSKLDRFLADYVLKTSNVLGGNAITETVKEKNPLHGIHLEYHLKLGVIFL